jgi:hypothetical protein
MLEEARGTDLNLPIMIKHIAALKVGQQVVLDTQRQPSESGK